MNSKIKSAIAACALLSVWTPHLLAMGSDHQIDEHGNIISQQPEWPAGLAELINAGPVFHGHWVNANSEFFFLGDTGSLTRFLRRYSSLTNTPLVVVLHAGSARRSELWGEKPTDRYDWKVIVLKRGWWPGLEKPASPQEQWVVTVDVWIDHDIRLADLVVPKNVQVKSAGEVETFVAKHNDAQPASAGDVLKAALYATFAEHKKEGESWTKH